MHTLSLSRQKQATESPDTSPSSRRAAEPPSSHNVVWQSIAVRPVSLQSKLIVGEANDPQEHEADRIADQVMSMSSPERGEASTDSQAGLRLRRRCEQCEDEEDKVQRRSVADTSSLEAPPLVHDALGSSGSPLDPATREFMESRFGHDFSGVRIHSDQPASASARAVSAQAYTVGSDIVLGSGNQATGTQAGRRLLAHELVHTIQQGRSQPFAGEAQKTSRQVSPSKVQRQSAAQCETDKTDPDTLGPLFVKQKSAVESLGLRKGKVKARVPGLPYVLFSPHCEAGKVPMRSLVDGGDAFVIKSGKIYQQVWAQQEGKPSDQLYWGWINPRLIDFPPPGPSVVRPPAVIPTPPSVAPPIATPSSSPPSATPVPADHEPEDVYATKLEEAVSLLQQAGFGRLEGTPKPPYPGAPVEWTGETYNRFFWHVEEHPRFGRKLVLNWLATPATAIDHMFNHLGEWNVDCAQFVQVAHLYAMRHYLGTRKFNELSDEVSFELKPQTSTGVRRKRLWERFKPGDAFLRYPEKEREWKSLETLLDFAPVGSRVMWTSLLVRADRPFRNENALKLDSDLYAAHGLAPKFGRNVYSREELEQAMVDETKADLKRETGGDWGEDLIRNNIFISEIEEYEKP